MGFLELLFLVLLVLKLAGISHLAWGYVFLPLVIGLVLDVIFFTLFVKFYRKGARDW